jgi:uncharacterized HAD superfamily protein
MKINNINSFQNISITENTLIFCDIDETILKYEIINHKWWKDKLEYYYNIHNNHNISNQCAYLEWKEYIYNNLPSYTDKNGFLKMLDTIKKTNSKLIFITAREKNIKNITIQQLKHLKINNYDILFVGKKKTKGLFIKDNFDISNILLKAPIILCR